MRALSLVPVALMLGAWATAQTVESKPASLPPELTKALAKATVHNQRVLAIFAAEGRDLHAEMKKDKALSRPLLYEFETVTLQGDTAHQLAVQWKLPDVLQQRPAVAVLDQTGKLLTSMLPDQFLADGKLDGKKLLERLQPHFCPPVDAEQKLAAAIAEAKKSGRSVFVRFDAPW